MRYRLPRTSDAGPLGIAQGFNSCAKQFMAQAFAEMAAREFDVKDFNAKDELLKIKAEDSELGITPAQGLGGGDAGTNPLTTPGGSDHTQDKGSLNSGAKKKIKDDLATL